MCNSSLTYGTSSLSTELKVKGNVTLTLSIIHPSESNGTRTYYVQPKSKIQQDIFIKQLKQKPSVVREYITLKCKRHK